MPLPQLTNGFLPSMPIATPRSSIPQPNTAVDKRAIADVVNREFVRRRQERQPWDLQWKLNFEFLLGNQNVRIDSIEGRVVPYKKQYWYQERSVFNQIRPIYLTRCSRLARMKPVVRVRPTSSEQEDIYACHVSTAILKQNWFDDDCAKKLVEATQWNEIQGTCFFGPRWDPQAGRFLGVLEAPTEDESPSSTRDVPGMGPRKARTVRVYEGDNTTDVIPAEYVYPDTPWRNDVPDCESIIIARVRSVKSVWDQYGVLVKPEKVQTTQLQPLMDAGGLFEKEPAYIGQSVDLADHVIEKHYMEKPSGIYSQGRYVIVAGDAVLYYEESLPFRVGKDETHAIPLVRIVAEARPGCLWGISVIDRLIPIQRRYNRVRNLQAEYLARIGIGVWRKPNGACEDKMLWQGPGGVITFNPIAGMKPEPVEWAPLPPEFRNEQDTCMQEFTAMGGVSELSRFSEAPPGVKAGVSLSIAQEQDDTRLSITAGCIEQAIVAWSRMRLRLYKQFVDNQRLVHDVGPDDLAETVAWSSEIIRSDNVILEAGPGLSDTPAQQQQKIYDMLESPAQIYAGADGQISSETKQKIFEGLQMASVEVTEPDEDSRHKKRIARENLYLKQGINPPVFRFDNHPLHIQRHDWDRLTAWYEAQMKTPQGPTLAMVYDQHNAAHVAYVQQMMAQMGGIPQQGVEAMMPSPQPQSGPSQQGALPPESEPIATPMGR